MLDRDRIVDTTDLASLADELLGTRRGTSRSASWPCPSPHHAQTGRTPPVTIFRARHGEERWHCHGCGIGGSAIDLVMAARGVAVGEALEDLARRTGVAAEGSAVPPLRIRRNAATEAPSPGDAAGLCVFVEECAGRLWCPDGHGVLQWLTAARGLPEDVLRVNRIGADLGRQRQRRPEGMPSTGLAAVLPVLDQGRPVFAQLRSVRPLPGRSRYLNASSRLAVNPRIAFYEPAVARGPCVVVTEGVIDGLSANAAGFRSAAVLGAALAAGNSDGAVAKQLAHLHAPLILAFDADEAGGRGATSLRRQLHERGVRAARIHVPAEANDLNGWMLRSRDWPRSFASAVRSAVVAAPKTRSLGR